MRLYAITLMAVLAAGSVHADADDSPAVNDVNLPGSKPPKKQEELLVYRNLFSLMSVAVLQPDSRVTFPDRFWGAIEYRWEIDPMDPRIEMMLGIRYERFRFIQESHRNDVTQSSDTGIHAFSYRKYFGVSLMQHLVHVGAAGSIGAAWEFSTDTQYDTNSAVYTDVKRRNRMFLYPGAVFYFTYKPVKMVSLDGEAMLNFFINDTVTPNPRLSLGIGLSF